MPAEPKDDPAAQEVLNHYLSASKGQSGKLRNMSMDVDIVARLPRLGKEGMWHGLRKISQIGQIAYKQLNFQGDNTIKKDVIARYMTAEVEAATKPNLAINDENYKFKFYGAFPQRDDWQLYLFALSPKKKMPGLFEGWLWIEAKTGLPVREQGTFVKTPSVFLKKFEFVRDYQIRNGVALPSHMEGSVDVRVVGKAEMSISFSNYQASDDTDAVATAFPAGGSR